MINILGKSLVVFNLGLSLVFLTFALGLFTNQVDWGWKEPRKEPGTSVPSEGADEKEKPRARVPSEIDKRTAAVKVFLRHREQVEHAVAQFQKELEVNEENWAAYHLEYVKILEELANAPGDISVKKVKRDNKGELVFDSTQPGKVILEGDVQYVPKDMATPTVVVNKSFVTYDEKLQELQKTVVKLEEQVAEETEKLKDRTILLDGSYKDPELKIEDEPGIYKLLEDEKQLQNQIKKAIAEIQPIWVSKGVEAQLLVHRRNALERRLEELKTKAPEKKP